MGKKMGQRNIEELPGSTDGLLDDRGTISLGLYFSLAPFICVDAGHDIQWR